MERLDNLTTFDFANTLRNTTIASDDEIKRMFTKTGTTIVGLLADNAVVLAADTRATAGNIVADRNCSKIHYISDNIYCCGAGTAADTFAVTEMCEGTLRLHSLKTGKAPRFQSAKSILADHLFRHQGYVSAALILGGYDCHGPHLCTVWPDGCADVLPYVTMGSGSLAAQSVLDTCYREGLPLEEATQLAIKAITAGIMNDMGSGSNVDVCVLTASGSKHTRSIAQPGTNSAEAHCN